MNLESDKSNQKSLENFLRLGFNRIQFSNSHFFFEESHFFYLCIYRNTLLRER